MSIHKRTSLFIALDTLFILIAFFSSFIIINEPQIYFNVNFWLSCTIILLSYHMFSFLYKMNKKAWEYASVGELNVILKTLTISIVFNAFIQLLIFDHIQYRILFITWLLMVVLIGGARFWWRMRNQDRKRIDLTKKRTLIVGAGSAGTMVARQLLQNQSADLRPVAFIDDDANKQKLDIYALPVAGSTADIPNVVDNMKIENIIIAIPSLKRHKLQQIYQLCSTVKVKTQILPMIEDLVTGKVSVKQFKNVSVEDLLGRETVELDNDLIGDTITGKNVLVTGAGGSIGSELCRQIINHAPKKLVLLGHGENSIYNIEMELKEIMSHSMTEIVTEIADIQDEKKLLTVFDNHAPEVVYHAAAHKHVPLMERNPEEAIKNNTIGSLNVATAAHNARVKTFVMVSTDKAVNPTSVMGASKRLAEMVIHDLNQKSKTIFTVVRFGNVLGSNGSVIPLFKKQIEKGGPVTVTHPDMVRYFMTIPEASRLVIQASCLAQGGETFVLDMGEPVKIVDLAKNLISLSGHSEEEIGIEFTGIRPGEKLYEELLNKDEIHDEQIFPKIYLGKCAVTNIHKVEKLLSSYALMDKKALRAKVLELTNGPKHVAESVSSHEELHLSAK
ncbi:polysaccharide biosynthesis protein [Salipaludibacillus agaradhaerens]|uniref:nucleoside-diphosphate sugar epimerase/dehydratase n=1 Tax=Salipaludibacillus agaradhaerens TaxID=76935 RepID=UPI002150A736|nr:nucleoside-diphosphate sugar epimerase/dehydratase [Salipaludibacillus agaradhaerens]MCR6106831.1 polysaccharide biosynthesis protein [Salipaludibacillus agaradhaerens]MCR6118863.1 polysaccharide biosynthesis protein [Salipaludibacillus agaradhaerens]